MRQSLLVGSGSSGSMDDMEGSFSISVMVGVAVAQREQAEQEGEHQKTSPYQDHEAGSIPVVMASDATVCDTLTV